VSGVSSELSANKNLGNKACFFNLELIYEKTFHQSELFFRSIAILAQIKLSLI
jgi:hypothetical protein